ncbi:MAG: hypothetical protein GXP41_11235 [Chloroflexi bacterium]|nr:hypothetical protein [Chloroflexota bacterium]
MARIRKRAPGRKQPGRDPHAHKPDKAKKETPSLIRQGGRLAPVANGVRELEAIVARQKTIGNAATAGLLQRQDKAGGGGAPPADRDGATTMAYRVVIGGKVQFLTPEQYELEKKKAVSGLRSSVWLIRARSKSGKESHEQFMKETHNWVGVISDIVAGVVPPSPAIWDLSEIWLKAAEDALANENLALAVKNVKRAEKRYNEASEKWYKYRQATIGGAEVTVKGLEITRDVSFAVAGALGGAVLAPAGASLIVSGGVSAGVGAGFKAVEDAATQLSELGFGLRKEFDFGKMFKDMGMAAITGFAGALTGGALKEKFFPKVIQGISGDVLREVSEATGEKITAEMFQTTGQKLLRDFLAGTGSTALNEAIKAVINKMDTGKKMTPEQFANEVAYQFTTGEGANQFAEWIKAYARK